MEEKKSGDWKREEQAMWRLECGKATAVEIEMWRSKSKEKKMKRGKMFLRVE